MNKNILYRIIGFLIGSAIGYLINVLLFTIIKICFVKLFGIGSSMNIWVGGVLLTVVYVMVSGLIKKGNNKHHDK